MLSSRAEEDLARAEKSGDYQVFSRALFAFQEAFALWDGNTKAKNGVSTAKLAYAKQAMKKEDFDLGASLLDAQDPTHADLQRQIVAAQRERDSRQQRLRNIKLVAAGLAVLMFVVVAAAFFQVRSDRDKAVVAQNQAEVAEKQAKSDRDEAVTQKNRADAAAKAQEIAATDAKNAEMAARTAETRAKSDRDVAEKAKVAEEYQAYIARIGLANAKIEDNAFDTAEQLLNDCPPNLRNWEWGRLHYLTTQSVHSFVPPVAAVPPHVAANFAVQAGDPSHDQAVVPVESVAFSRDGERFISGSWDGKARIWDVKSDKLLLTIPFGGLYVHAVAFSPDGKYVALGGSKAAGVQICDAQNGAPIRKIAGHDDDVSSIAFSRDGRRLLTGSYDGSAGLWDVKTGAELHRYVGHNWWVWSAAFSADESRIVTASQDGTVMVWPTNPPPNPNPRPDENKLLVQPSVSFTGHKGPVNAA
ncbi:MAG TPA: hypothetical protein VGX78_20370, partial [Pirellulales bacterium]|nr:hypothetical protein [Pirellulales bacterium]